jgi:hypothetical protein
MRAKQRRYITTFTLTLCPRTNYLFFFLFLSPCCLALAIVQIAATGISSKKEKKRKRLQIAGADRTWNRAIKRF